MSKTKASTPKGMRDFSPVEMMRRKYVFSTIERVFQKYGFLPLETPAMENLSTLTGKYGEEGDRLIFKVLNSGDYLKKAGVDRDNGLADIHSVSLTSKISDKALRYDLTVPFARYVVQHQNELTFPFKRYQIQPVWRADRPQKGRYREFTQCDADIIGSNSLLNELDLIAVFSDVFTELDLPVRVHLNDRKILTGLAEISGQADKVVDMVTALDKLDKIGRDKVVAEMRERGITDEAVAMISPLFDLKGGSEEMLASVASVLECSETGMAGVEDLRWMMVQTQQLGLSAVELVFDPTLARGLDYYTGAIFEVKAAIGSMSSSICGGGRYDDLTGVFGLNGMSGVGISFGADRIYDVLMETGKFPEGVSSSTRVLFANFGEQEARFCMKLVSALRREGVPTELYPDPVKMKKQFKYADDKQIRFVAMVGEQEMKQEIISVKDLVSGEQKAVKEQELIELVK